MDNQANKPIHHNSEGQGATLNHVPIFHGLLLRFTLPMQVIEWTVDYHGPQFNVMQQSLSKILESQPPPFFREVLEIDVSLASNLHS